ncbi:2-hydroxy-3-oxopropionate reductase [Propionivibrio sp.]|uniref:2-hydroxy-3-oxopropionate reductase n=1 Tax=Propionivibrio sp. TaxID=2212460 RepID=UPI0039E2F5C2
MSKKIGFIGLGIMGKPMSKNLLKAGYDLTVCDINAAAVAEVVALGAKAAATPAAVAAQTEIVITMLPNSPQVKTVALGAGGIAEGARPGTIVIDMSSIAPLAAQEVAKALAEKGVRMIDAPVSGGEPKAIDATLSIMVGGDPAVFEECLPILKCMGASAVRVGDVGAGNVTKLANQVVVALNIAALSEAMTLATKAGVDPELVFNAIKGGLAGSTVMNAKAPLILERKFAPGFRIGLHIKDLDNALDTAHEVGAPLPLTAGVMEILQALKVDGCAGDDHGAIVKYYEKLAQVEVRRQA